MTVLASDASPDLLFCTPLIHDQKARYKAQQSASSAHFFSFSFSSATFHTTHQCRIYIRTEILFGKKQYTSSSTQVIDARHKSWFQQHLKIQTWFFESDGRELQGALGQRALRWNRKSFFLLIKGNVTFNLALSFNIKHFLVLQNVDKSIFSLL
jgi:hypothetical protein